MVLQRQKERVSRLPAAAALGATLLVSSVPALADDAPASQSLAATQNIIVPEVDLVDAVLPVALKLIKQQTGIEVVFLGDGQQYERITLSLHRRPLPDVLRLMAKAAKAECWQENGVYMIGPLGSGPKIQEEPVLPSNTIPDAPDLNYTQRWERIKLNYIHPHTLLRWLGIGNGSPQDISEMVAMNTYRWMIDNQIQPVRTYNTSRNSVIIQNGASPANTVVPAAPTVPTGQNSGPVNGNSNNGLSGNLNGTSSGGDQGYQRDEEFQRGGQRGGFGGGGFQGGGGGGFGGGQGLGGGGGQGLGGQGQGQGGAGSGLLGTIQPNDIFAYDAQNELLFRVSGANGEQNLRDLRQIVQLLDVKPRQILVRAEFVTVTQNDVSSFGINWSFQRVNLVTGVSTGFQANSTAFLQYATGNLQTQLSYILTTGRGKLVAAPMATTLNNVPITFANVQNTPIITSTPIIAQNGTVALSPQVQYIAATTGLAILPRINGDDTLTLFGSVFVSDFGTPVTGPNGEQYPTQINQTAPVQRIIRNGDTMVVGGLTSKNNSVSSNRVPLLGDLPLIGTLFRSRQVNTRDSDLLVFITASILPERTPPSAIPGLGAGAGLPGGGSGGVLPPPGPGGAGGPMP